MRLTLIKTISLPVVLLLANSSWGAGWGFTPEPREWASWPQHCRVQYSYINRGQNEYGDYFAQTLVDSWTDLVGVKTFGPAHHYCAALIYLNRARHTTDPKWRKFLIGQALDDGFFTYSRAEPTSILYPNIAVVMAQAKYEDGQDAEAFQILETAIAAQPERFEAYGAMAAIYRQQRKTAMARDILKRADVASGGKSAEIKYNLGLVQIELGDIDDAVVSAKEAYELGHPLPGLRDKLKKLGR